MAPKKVELKSKPSSTEEKVNVKNKSDKKDEEIKKEDSESDQEVEKDEEKLNSDKDKADDAYDFYKNYDAIMYERDKIILPNDDDDANGDIVNYTHAQTPTSHKNMHTDNKHITRQQQTQPHFTINNNKQPSPQRPDTQLLHVTHYIRLPCDAISSGATSIASSCSIAVNWSRTVLTKNSSRSMDSMHGCIGSSMPSSSEAHKSIGEQWYDWCIPFSIRK